MTVRVPVIRRSESPVPSTFTDSAFASAPDAKPSARVMNFWTAVMGLLRKLSRSCNFGRPSGSFAAQSAAGPVRAVVRPAIAANSSSMIASAARPRGTCHRSKKRIVGCSTSISTKASTIGRTISAAR
jgi:hypothetical protein